jgi:hypothetical protein
MNADERGGIKGSRYYSKFPTIELVKISIWAIIVVFLIIPTQKSG